MPASAPPSGFGGAGGIPSAPTSGPAQSSTAPAGLAGRDPTSNPKLYGLDPGEVGEPVQGLVPPSAGANNLPGLTGVVGVGIPGLGLPGSQGPQTTIAEALEAMMHFSRDDIKWLQQQLKAAGYFTSSSASGAPIDGVADPNTIKAYVALLEDAFRSGSTAADVIASRQQGTSDQLGSPTKSIEGILKHGTDVEIDLTNPTDLEFALNKMFNSVLERNATPEEKASFVANIQKMQHDQGMSKQDAANASLQKEFDAQKASRDQTLQNQAAQDAGPQGSATSSTVGNVTLATTPKGAPGVAGFLAATIAHESLTSGQYTALNKGSGAGGAYQFLPSTWRSEATKYGFSQYANTPPQQVPPAVQDAVAAAYATELYAKAGGDWAKVAKAWYGGEGNMNTPDSVQPNKGLSLGAYANFVTTYMAQHGTSTTTPQDAGLAGLGTGSGTVAGSAPTSAAGGYVNPLSQGQWGLARTDQGVDYIPKTPSPILALGNGVVIRSTMTSGWPGGAFIAYKLTDGPAAGQVVFVAEHLSGLVPVGTKVTAGQQIAIGQPGYPYIETGWANSTGTAPIVQYGTAPDGTPMEGGKDFARLMIKLGAGAMQDPGDGPIFPGGPNSSAITGLGASTNTGLGVNGNTIGDTTVGPDQFIPGQAIETTNAADPNAEAYKMATTGPLRRSYLATSSTGAYAEMLGIIKNKGLSPTGNVS